MSIYQVEQPILNSPFSEPSKHWNILSGEPERLPGRRRPIYYYRAPNARRESLREREAGSAIVLKLVNRIRQRLSSWRMAGYPGITSTTRRLLSWWHLQRLFFAQLEAAETIIFLTEAPAEFLLNISIPDDPTQGEPRFLRLACKMASGTGKTTVMAMLAAWSILNKVHEPRDERFSDLILIVCPNATICDQLRQLIPDEGEESLYVRRKLVPPDLMPTLSQGRVITTIWHLFEQVQRINERLGLEGTDILVMNACAEYAIRMASQEMTQSERQNFADDEAARAFFSAATLWMDGLEQIHQQKGIKLCLDFSAIPYFLAGTRSNRPFPWIVSDFSLAEAIESGLVKVPQLAERAPAPSLLYPFQRHGQAFIPGAMNLWEWILPQLAPYELQANLPKSYAILKYAERSLNLLGLLWEKEREGWEEEGIAAGHETRRVNAPVFLIVCQNLEIAQVVYKWLAENEPPFGVPPSMNRRLFNDNGQLNTILLDCSRPLALSPLPRSPLADAARWMDLTLASVGKREWAKTSQGEPIYPTDFEELAKKLGKPLHPPGRDVYCVISAGLLLPPSLSAVTHIIALHPFTSQLQCEMVIGSVLARESDEDHQGQLREEVLKVCGIPFEVVPFKANDAWGTMRGEPDVAY